MLSYSLKGSGNISPW